MHRVENKTANILILNCFNALWGITNHALLNTWQLDISISYSVSQESVTGQNLLPFSLVVMYCANGDYYFG